MRSIHVHLGIPALASIINILQLAQPGIAFPQVAPGVPSGEGQITGPASTPEWVILLSLSLLMGIHSVSLRLDSKNARLGWMHTRKNMLILYWINHLTERLDTHATQADVNCPTAE